MMSGRAMAFRRGPKSPSPASMGCDDLAVRDNPA